MREFKFFTGYGVRTITDQLEELLREYPVTVPGINWNGINQLPTWTGTTYNPTWVVNPGLIQYAPPTHTILTTTHGTGTYTIPYSGTINTASGFSLTTSSGTAYTTLGTTSNTFLSNTGTFTCSSNIK